MQTIKIMILNISELPAEHQPDVIDYLKTSGTSSLMGGKNIIQTPRNAGGKSVTEQLKNNPSTLTHGVQATMLWVEEFYNLKGVDSVMIDRVVTQNTNRKLTDELEFEQEK